MHLMNARVDDFPEDRLPLLPGREEAYLVGRDLIEQVGDHGEEGIHHSGGVDDHHLSHTLRRVVFPGAGREEFTNKRRDKHESWV